MRVIMLICLLLSLLAQAEGQGEPRVRLLSTQRCDTAIVIVIEVANDSTTNHIYFPLSPQYSSGHTVHNLRLQVEKDGSWQPLERGLDTHPAGFRDLGPGEKLIDKVGVPLSAANSLAQSNARMRVQMPFKLRLSGPYRDAVSKPFAYKPPATASAQGYLCPK